MAITFMAKWDEREGNSCHIHLSLADDGRRDSVFAADRSTFDRFVAGQLACMRELTLMFAPQVNSYKRFVDGSFAPTAVAWGRTTAPARCASSGTGRRSAWRTAAGADVNPYLALAAMIAAGLHGIDEGLELEPPSLATPTSPTSRACRTRSAARDLLRSARSPATRSATRSSTTT